MHDLSKFTPRLLDDRPSISTMLHETAGVFISGDPGSGKSVLAREVIREAAESGEMAVIHLDPEGDGYEDSMHDVADMGPSVRDRVYAFAPCQPNLPIGPIHPLAVYRDEHTSDYEYANRLECRCSHTAHIILNIFGADTIDAYPLLYKWLMIVLRSLAKMRLSLADSIHFISDIGSDFHRHLTSLIPDTIARIEFERLAAQRIERQEDQILSIKNRLYALLTSPALEAHLSCVDPERTVDFRRMIRERCLVFYNLSQGEEVLSREAQSLLANLVLSEVFHVLFTTPRAERVPVLIVCDELPVFRASAPLITQALRRTRKALCRFVGLAQGTNAFPEGTDDPLLRTMTSCANGVYFCHSDPVDAEYFGRVVGIPNRDPQLVKYEHEEWVQFEARKEIWMTVNHSIERAYGASDTEGGGGSAGASESHETGVGIDVNRSTTQTAQHTEGTGDTETTSHAEHDSRADTQTTTTNEQAVAAAFANARQSAHATADATSQGKNRNTSDMQGTAEQQGQTVKRNQSRGASRSQSHEWSYNRSHSSLTASTTSYTQQIVPILDWRRVVRLELMPIDEQDKMYEALVTLLNTGWAFFCTGKQRPFVAYVYRTPDPLLDAPEHATRQLVSLYESMFEAPCYHDPERLLRERNLQLQLALAELQRAAALAAQTGQGLPHERLQIPELILLPEANLHDEDLEI